MKIILAKAEAFRLEAVEIYLPPTPLQTTAYQVNPLPIEKPTKSTINPGANDPAVTW